MPSDIDPASPNDAATPKAMIGFMMCLLRAAHAHHELLVRASWMSLFPSAEQVYGARRSRRSCEDREALCMCEMGTRARRRQSALWSASQCLIGSDRRSGAFLSA